MEVQLRHFFVIFLVSVPVEGNNGDPCNNSPHLPMLSLRTSNYEPDIGGGERYICDKNIIPELGQWYKVDNNDLVMNETDPYTCGTQNAIWTNDKLPTKPGDIFDINACVPGLIDGCEQKLPIKVKNCGTTRVYFLLPPESCPSSYCFGIGDNVPAPNVSVSKPQVKPDLKKINHPRINQQQLIMKCDFPAVAEKEKYYYQIFWYFNGRLEIGTKIVKFQNLGMTDLKDEQQRQFQLLGKNVACGVRLRLSEKGAPGDLSMSDPFFAGIMINKTVLTLYRGETLQIAMKPTIPFGCLYHDQNSPTASPCDLRIEMSVPPPSGHCSGAIGAAKNIDHCGIKILSTKWHEEHYFNITWMDDNTYNLQRGRYVVRFKIGKSNDNHHLWDNYQLPDIHVQLEEKNTEWKGTYCYAHSDPHFRTFDNKRYDNQWSGTFIMYQNKGKTGKTITQVQYTVTPCNIRSYLHPKCICGIAVRAGGDVYIINRCPEMKRPYFGFKSCRDNLLDVRKENEKKYKIYLPSGTYILIELQYYTGKHVMNVDIHPTVMDEGQTEGLCGNLNGNPNDEFDIPDRTEDGFKKHWTVKDDTTNLFKFGENDFENLQRWDIEEFFCTCPSTKDEQDLNDEVKCTPSSSVKCSRTEEHVVTKCIVKDNRYKRSAFRFKPDNTIPSTKHLSRFKRDTSHYGVGMTDAQAKTYCENFMSKSTAFQQCTNVPNVHPSEAIETCILDIKLTNSTEWSEVSRESVKNVCLKEIKANSTLQDSQDNKTSIAEIVKTVCCPNECSEHGSCVNGTCNCEEGFGAADCSIDLNAPPVVYGVNLDDGGLCDSSDCENSFVEGDLFIKSEKLTCKLEYFEISFEGNMSMPGTSTIRKAQHNTIAEVLCPLTKERKRREIIDNRSFVHGYEMSVSNNGKQFSTKHKLYILDSRCQDTANVSGQLVFVLKEGFCFIRGQCVLDGTADGSNPCRVCQTDRQVLDWTSKDCHDSEEKSKLWIIGVVLGCVAIILFAIVGVYLLKRHKIKRARVQSEVFGPPEPPPYKQGPLPSPKIQNERYSS